MERTYERLDNFKLKKPKNETILKKCQVTLEAAMGNLEELKNQHERDMKKKHKSSLKNVAK